RHSEDIAQRPQQRHVAGCIDLTRLSVDVERDHGVPRRIHCLPCAVLAASTISFARPSGPRSRASGGFARPRQYPVSGRPANVLSVELRDRRHKRVASVTTLTCGATGDRRALNAVSKAQVLQIATLNGLRRRNAVELT